MFVDQSTGRELQTLDGSSWRLTYPEGGSNMPRTSAAESFDPAQSTEVGQRDPGSFRDSSAVPLRLNTHCQHNRYPDTITHIPGMVPVK